MVDRSELCLSAFGLFLQYEAQVSRVTGSERLVSLRSLHRRKLGHAPTQNLRTFLFNQSLLAIIIEFQSSHHIGGDVCVFLLLKTALFELLVEQRNLVGIAMIREQKISARPQHAINLAQKPIHRPITMPRLKNDDHID